MNQNDADEQVINPNVIQEAQHLLRQCFANPCEIKSATFLSEPDRRNVVLRLYLENKSNDIPAKQRILSRAPYTELQKGTVFLTFLQHTLYLRYEFWKVINYPH
jgi:hypothetical protein